MVESFTPKGDLAFLFAVFDFVFLIDFEWVDRGGSLYIPLKEKTLKEKDFNPLENVLLPMVTAFFGIHFERFLGYLVYILNVFLGFWYTF